MPRAESPAPQRAMYVLDSNLYIRALTEPAFAHELDAFQRVSFSELWVSAVVAFEVAAGARSDQQAAGYDRWLLRPFRNAKRLLVPSREDWQIVGRIDRSLRSRGGHSATLTQRSFLNDMLIAATCRTTGATLITANRADFELIDSAVGFRFRTDFPAT